MTKTAIDKQATDHQLAAKVASMSADQRCVRMQEIVDSPERSSNVMLLEFAKLIMGPNATIS